MRENIAFGRPDATDEEVVRAATLAQAHEFIDELPDGYDTIIGERGITLSGGQRQRLAIARALIMEPRILILDDATASVDATTEARIRLGLREAMKGRTTIIIAHRLSTISLADELVVLDRGRVVGRGTDEELLEDERGLPRHPRARPPRARVRGPGGGEGRMRVWQPGSHLSAPPRREGRGLVVAAHGPAGLDARPARRALQAPDALALASLVAATLTALAPPYLAKLVIDDGIRAEGRAHADDRRRAVHRRRRR